MNENKDFIKFKNNNGYIMRTISNLFSVSWFTGRELKTALSSYGISISELNRCLKYLIQRKYLLCQFIESHAIADIARADIDEVELTLTPDGELVIYSQIVDAMIEI